MKSIMLQENLKSMTNEQNNQSVTRRIPDWCPRCKHYINDFLGCDDCDCMCVPYIAKHNLYVTERRKG